MFKFRLQFALALLLIPGIAAAQAYRAEVLETKTICIEKDRYLGWPTVCKTKGGRLIVAFSGDRDRHVCPWGKTQIITSDDNGKTWSDPVTITNSPLDDRDAGIVETPTGTLVVTWFTSVAFARSADYARHAEKVTPELRDQWLGSWTRRSTDGGATWEPPVRMASTAPHGSIVLRDGRLMQVGKRLFTETQAPGLGGEMLAEVSADEGRSWQVLAHIGIPANEKCDHYHEPHLAELPDGKLVAMFRYEPPEDKEQHFLRQSESIDGGKTWTETHKTPLWGYPPHLLVLKDGRLLVVYGRRKDPNSERASISSDGGTTWGPELTLCEAANSDLGYPSSVQLDDETILTVYYQDQGRKKETCLWSTHWRIVKE